MLRFHYISASITQCIAQQKLPLCQFPLCRGGCEVCLAGAVPCQAALAEVEEAALGPGPRGPQGGLAHGQLRGSQHQLRPPRQMLQGNQLSCGPCLRGCPSQPACCYPMHKHPLASHLARL